METNLHAVLLIMSAIVATFIIWRFGTRKWTVNGSLQGTAIRWVTGLLVMVVTMPTCAETPAPTTRTEF